MDPTEVSELTNYIKEWCLRPSLNISPHIANQENDVQGDVEDTAGHPEVTEEQDLVSEGLKHDGRGFSDVITGQIRSPSVPITEVLPSSPGEMPPSSFISECEKLESSPAANVSLPSSRDTLPGAKVGRLLSF